MGLKSVLGGSKKEGAGKRTPVRNESTRTEPVDEHKQLARRRLVGSVALLLIAIVVLPLVLEDAPRPVAPDIALQIPSRDLPVESPKIEAAKPEAPKVEAPKVEAPKVEAPKVEVPKVEAPKAEAPKAEAPKGEAPKPKPAEPKVAEVKAAEPKAGKHLPVVDDPIAGFANAKVNPTTQTAAAAPKSNASAEAPSSPSAARSNHWVQMGAFANETKARDMASQLRGKGYPAVTEVVRGGSSELYRVRVGPLETRESASRVRDNLAKSGFDGAVVQ